MRPNAGGCGCFQIRQVPREERVDRSRIEAGQRHLREGRLLPNGVGRPRCGQITFRFLNLGVDFGIGGETAEGIDRQCPARGGWDRVLLCPQIPIVNFDPCHMPL